MSYQGTISVPVALPMWSFGHTNLGDRWIPVALPPPACFGLTRFAGQSIHIARLKPRRLVAYFFAFSDEKNVVAFEYYLETALGRAFTLKLLRWIAPAAHNPRNFLVSCADGGIGAARFGVRFVEPSRCSFS